VRVRNRIRSDVACVVRLTCELCVCRVVLVVAKPTDKVNAHEDKMMLRAISKQQRPRTAATASDSVDVGHSDVDSRAGVGSTVAGVYWAPDAEWDVESQECVGSDVMVTRTHRSQPGLPTATHIRWLELNVSTSFLRPRVVAKVCRPRLRVHGRTGMNWQTMHAHSKLIFNSVS
jgi:hypothetical protein